MPPLESETAIDAHALLGEQPREVRADVAEALDRDAGVVQPRALLLERRPDAVERAAGGRAVAADRPAERERLAGDDAEHRVADVHRVRVHDPRHHLGVGADVGRGNVLLGADLVDDLARVAPREPLLLAERERLRVADDAALGAAEREAHQRALPRHPHRERLHLVLRHGRVVADAALGRAARHVVDDAVALERPHGAVVHLHGHRHLDALLAVGEDLDQVRVDGEGLADPAQLRLGELERVLAEMRRKRGGGAHAWTPSLTTRRLYPGRPAPRSSRPARRSRFGPAPGSRDRERNRLARRPHPRRPAWPRGAARTRRAAGGRRPPRAR